MTKQWSVSLSKKTPNRSEKKEIRKQWKNFKKLAMASARMFKVLVKYIAIHEYMKLSLHAR